MITRIDSSRLRTARHTSIPLPSPNRASNTATSTHSAGIRRSARRRLRLPDHLDVRLVLQQLAQTPPHHLVVIEEEHPNRMPPFARRRRSPGWSSLAHRMPGRPIRHLEPPAGDLIRLDPDDVRLGRAVPRKQRQLEGVQRLIHPLHLPGQPLDHHTPRHPTIGFIPVHLERHIPTRAPIQLRPPAVRNTTVA